MTLATGHHEQVPVVLRYYDERTNMPAERFVAIQRLMSVDALSVLTNFIPFFANGELIGQTLS
jgi:hypothetical protein